jgi:SAM-dependent methyltransferase
MTSRWRSSSAITSPGPPNPANTVQHRDNSRQHWDRIYRARRPEELSWYQRRPEASLALIASSAVGRDSGIIDVGGGSSTLADCLLDAGFTRLAVLDVSEVALTHARLRLGERARFVEWLVADVTAFTPPHRFALWHDRAVFHFLTTSEERQAYLASLRRTLLEGGSLVMATFTTDGPTKCSGLKVMRYDEQAILAELGAEFRLVEMRCETHYTPARVEQRFAYFRLLWEP